jgi:hypothetical protein
MGMPVLKPTIAKLEIPIDLKIPGFFKLKFM